MAHNIDQSLGFAAIALAQHRGPAWHNLGQYIGDTADLAEWQRRSGTDFTVLERAMFFAGQPTAEGKGKPVKVDDRKALVRSDTYGYLATVGDGYEVVQPTELFEFQARVIEATGAKMDVAGSLRDGRVLWTQAYIDKSTLIKGVDREDFHFLATTNFGQGRASTFGLKATRTVCENTMRVALGEKGDITVNHSRKVDIARIAAQLVESAEEAIDQRRTMTEALADVVVDERAALEFIRRVIPNAITVTKDKRGFKDVAELSHVARKVITLAGRGQGADLATAAGTAWGLVNSVTAYVDHYQKAKNPAARLHSAWFGAGAARKDEAMNVAREMFLTDPAARNLDTVDGSDVLDSLLSQPVRRVA